MLEYTKAGEGARLAMLILHDDAKREYAYGPAQGLPASKVGTFTQALYDEATKQGWTVIIELKAVMPAQVASAASSANIFPCWNSIPGFNRRARSTSSAIDQYRKPGLRARGDSGLHVPDRNRDHTPIPYL